MAGHSYLKNLILCAAFNFITLSLACAQTNLREVISVCAQRLKQENNDLTCLRALGEAYSELRMFDSSQYYLSWAYSLQKSDIPTAMNYCKILFLLGRYETSREVAYGVLQGTQTPSVEGLEMIARTYLEQNQHDSAKSFYERAYLLDSLNPRILNGAALAYYLYSKKSSQARLFSKRSIILDSLNWNYYNTMALIVASEMEYKTALLYLEAASRLNHNALTFYLMSHCYKKLGNTIKSRKFQKKAKRLNFNPSPSLQVMLQRLNES